ncbi:MAG: response regulator [Rubrivivax sp.]|nr:response regulator [Rubrivivax sp.]
MHPTIPHRVALLGFSEFERETLGAYFRLASGASQAYVPWAALDGADFVVADADHAPTIEAVLAAGRSGDTVFVGAAAPPDTRAWLARPIDPLHVLRELDAMAAGKTRRPVAAPAAAPVPQTRSAATGFIAVDPPAPVAPPPRPPRRRALVVDDSEVARRFLQSRLQRLGLAVDTAADSEQALALLSARHHTLVVVDVDLGDDSPLDGLALCHRLKREAAAAGSPPQVWLVSAHHAEVDRVRGTLAGCDLYLAKPLGPGTLEDLLHRHGFADTDHASAR